MVMNTAALVYQLSALMCPLRFGALLLTIRTTVTSQRLLTWCTPLLLLSLVSPRQTSNSCVIVKLSEFFSKRLDTLSSLESSTPFTTNPRTCARLRMTVSQFAASCKPCRFTKTSNEERADSEHYNCWVYNNKEKIDSWVRELLLVNEGYKRKVTKFWHNTVFLI